MNKPFPDSEMLQKPVRVPAEAYISREYAAQEQERLWRKVWLQAGRTEDLKKAGDFITYEIGSDSVVIVLDESGDLAAYHNVCPHRGRRLVDVPSGERNACGTRKNFICGYHGWTFGLDGENTFVEHEEDWQGALCNGRGDLSKVCVESWGGWIFINLDPECEPLADFLGVIPQMLEPYQLQNMRARWRKWIIFDCNWKVAMEAFCETYHVATTHPEFNAYGKFRGWSRNHGLHTNIGYEAPKGMEEDTGKMRVGTEGIDPRATTAEMQNYTWEAANTNTTEKLVEVANRLVDELPEGTSAAEVSAYWIKTAREEDAARGVVWPEVAPEHTVEAGTAWQVFPNFQIGQGVQNMLCYQARPYKGDPDKCIFEASVYQLYPDGEEPETQWEYTEPEDWPPVLQQDFSNMAAVQEGMKSAGFAGAQPNPYMERAVASLHTNLARYMGAGEPVPLD
ncbi:aromatic ring-hydroxylating oxygenase subunit alpha [Pontixanthobacter aquaemixtae]|uniref:Rieske 2Fe-2S domain-containing protein n=1 Tax=Pontixanthobacter aquaemixtae TaxID=1958940 RepID=A0A844ZNI2_9SPHN|nr:aromatic ring-hydroxylating dioxygenase subunit alpha [Pontixanthobacter aquaemixtae]MXO89931.1 Rieske 2Fe-2S domain-containing protein [Pontixanthobacter aquaemixtae]